MSTFRNLLRPLRRDLDDWGRREPVWSVFVLLIVGLFFTFAAAHGLRANWDPMMDDLALGSAWLLLAAAKLEVSRVWRTARRAIEGRIVRASVFDPQTGKTTVYDMSQERTR